MLSEAYNKLAKKNTQKIFSGELMMPILGFINIFFPK